MISAKFWIIPDFVTLQPSSSPDLSLAFLNSQKNESAVLAFLERRETRSSDVIAFAEFPEDLDVSTRPEFRDWPFYAQRSATINIWGKRYETTLLLASKLPFERVNSHVWADAGHREPIEARLLIKGCSLDLLIAHPAPPALPFWADEQDKLIRMLQSHLVDEDHFILMGDFNTTPWSMSYKNLPGQRVADPRLLQTWHSPIPFLGLPLDHVFIGPGVTPTRFEIGANVGSDHSPVFTQIALNSSCQTGPKEASLAL